LFLFFMIFFILQTRNILLFLCNKMRLYGNIVNFVKNTLHFILSSHALLFHETVSGLRDGVGRQGGEGFSDPEVLYISWRVWTEVWRFQVKTPASCECINNPREFFCLCSLTHKNKYVPIINIFHNIWRIAVHNLVEI